MNEFNCTASPLFIGYEFLKEERTPARLGLFIFQVFCSFFFLFIFVFTKMFLEYERLRARKISLAVMGFCVTFITSQTGPGIYVYGYLNFPCWIRSLLVMIIVPLMMANAACRLLTFFFLNLLHKQIVQAHTNHEFDFDATQKTFHLKQVLGDVSYGLYSLIFLPKDDNDVSSSSSNRTTSTTRHISALYFVASNTGILVIFTFMLIPFVLVAVALIIFEDPVYLEGCTGCIISKTLVIEMIITGIIGILFCSYAAYKIRKFPDPWKLRREVGYMTFWSLIALLGFIFSAFDIFIKTEFESLTLFSIGFTGFLGAQTIHQVIVSIYEERGTQKLRRRYRKSRKEEIMEQHQQNKKGEDQQHEYDGDTPRHSSNLGGTLHKQQNLRKPQPPQQKDLSINTIMSSPELLELFEDFLVKELGSESLLFLIDSETWKTNYYDNSAATRLSRAKKIYNTYINPNGTLPLNIPDSEVMEAKKQIFNCTESNSIEYTVFDSIRGEISYLLQIGAIKRFQNSSTYAIFQRTTATTSSAYTLGSTSPGLVLDFSKRASDISLSKLQLVDSNTRLRTSDLSNSQISRTSDAVLENAAGLF